MRQKPFGLERGLHGQIQRELEHKDEEIERLADMCQRREEFIAKNGLWGEFNKWLAEPTDAGSVT